MEKFAEEFVATSSTSNEQNSLSNYSKRPRLGGCMGSSLSTNSPLAYNRHGYYHSSDDFNISTTINSYIEPSDEEILEWQETQLSRSIVDNTVNRVVESYITLFDETINRPNTGLEESAILMAINEHGLQQNQNNDEPTTVHNSPTIPSPQIILPTCNISNDHKPENGLNNSQDDGFNNDFDTETSKTMVAVPPTNSLYSDDDGSDSEHFDFIEAAVAVAIRKKGLTPYSIEMSSNR